MRWPGKRSCNAATFIAKVTRPRGEAVFYEVCAYSRQRSCRAGGVIVAGSRAAFAATDPAAWVASFWPTAKAAGVTRATYDRALQGFVPDADVLADANAQPEFTWKVWDYVDQLVSDDR